MSKANSAPSLELMFVGTLDALADAETDTEEMMELVNVAVFIGSASVRDPF